MKKTVYDFTEAEKELQQWYSPQELSTMLREAALNLAPLCDYCQDNSIAEMQIVTLSACRFLDKIKEVAP